MPNRDYSPVAGNAIGVKGTTTNNYTKMYNDNTTITQPLNRNSFYINATPKTIKEFSHYDLNLNYSSVLGYIDANNVSEIDLIDGGFAKINLSDKEKESAIGQIKYVEGNIKNEFLVKIADNGRYFNLYVPVVDVVNNS